MGARPPKYDWPIKWPEPENVPQWVLGGIIFFAGVFVLFALGLVAKFIGAVVTNDDPKNIQALGLTILAIVGVPFAIWRTVVAQGNLDRAKDRDYADLFTKAVEQLGATREVREWDEEIQGDVYRHEPNTEVRLGAIYALERISQDSERDHIAVMDVLCAYVRENSPVNLADLSMGEFLKNSEPTKIREISVAVSSERNHRPLKKPANDIQAIVSVLGRRQKDRIKLESSRRYQLDLREVNLQMIDFAECDFRNGLFTGTNMDFAYLRKADLSGAKLWEVKARFADFRDAVLVGTDLTQIDARAAYFKEANLSRSFIFKADLRHAALLIAEMHGANVCGTDFSEAYGFAPSIFDQCFGDRSTKARYFGERPKHWYNGSFENWRDSEVMLLDWLQNKAD